MLLQILGQLLPDGKLAVEQIHHCVCTSGSLSNVLSDDSLEHIIVGLIHPEIQLYALGKGTLRHRICRHSGGYADHCIVDHNSQSVMAGCCQSTVKIHIVLQESRLMVQTCLDTVKCLLHGLNIR